MTFSAKKTLADLDLTDFPFTDLNDKPRALPHLKSLDGRRAAIALEGDLEAALKGLGYEDDLAAIEDMPVGVQQELAKAWMVHAEAAPGESEDSSPSSASTASPSKPTSRSTTTSKTRKR